jgi:hypothetical protein
MPYGPGDPYYEADQRQLHRSGPTESELLTAGLIAAGMFGSRRGQSALGRLKRIAGLVFALSIPIPVIVFAAAKGVPLLDTLVRSLLATPVVGQVMAVGLIAGIMGSLLSGAFWLKLAFAQWLTRDDEEDADSAYAAERGRDGAGGTEHRRGRLFWFAVVALAGVACGWYLRGP